MTYAGVSALKGRGAAVDVRLPPRGRERRSAIQGPGHEAPGQRSVADFVFGDGAQPCREHGVVACERGGMQLDGSQGLANAALAHAREHGVLETFARAVGRLLAYPDFRAALERRAFALASRWRWPAIGQAYRSAFAEAIDRRSNGRYAPETLEVMHGPL